MKISITEAVKCKTKKTISKIVIDEELEISSHLLYLKWPCEVQGKGLRDLELVADSIIIIRRFVI